MTVITPPSFSPDVIQLVLAIAAIGSLIVGWIASRSGRDPARLWIILGAILIVTLVIYSLITTWLFTPPPAST